MNITTMREFFELVNEYPWTTFFLIIGLCWILENVASIIHGNSSKIIIKDKDDK